MLVFRIATYTVGRHLPHLLRITNGTASLALALFRLSLALSPIGNVDSCEGHDVCTDSAVTICNVVERRCHIRTAAIKMQCRILSCLDMGHIASQSP